jgi:hypothetical protein
MTASLPPDRASTPDRATTNDTPLFGREGELISLLIATEPRDLENLLEVLASLDFPVNPQLYHRSGQVLVEFPAYSTQVGQVRKELSRNGFDEAAVQLSRPLARQRNE